MIVDAGKLLNHRSHMERGQGAEDRDGPGSEHRGPGGHREGGVQRRGQRNTIAELVVEERKAPEEAEAGKGQVRGRSVASTPSATSSGA